MKSKTYKTNGHFLPKFNIDLSLRDKLLHLLSVTVSILPEEVNNLKTIRDLSSNKSRSNLYRYKNYIEDLFQYYVIDMLDQKDRVLIQIKFNKIKNK